MNSMAADEQDTKPFLSPTTTIPRAHPGYFSACHHRQMTAAAPPLDQHSSGAGVAAAGQQHATAACVLNQASDELPEEDGADGNFIVRRLQGETSCSAPVRRISRSFWSAGEYDTATSGSSSVQPPRNVQNRMCVHPKFLHSNATSHKWPFGAVAELLDNAIDEIKTGATRIIVDKVNGCNGSPALLVQDDGGGMDPDSLRRCMSFGFSEKQSGSSIGQYGNGFKTGTMRLGADVIVFSRCMKTSEPTQSIGLLSYTFLAETNQKDVVVPVVDYKYNLLTGDAKPHQRLGPDQFSLNLSVLLKWSPFATEEQLIQNFSDIGPHGTKIVVFNLWSNDNGDLELDFDTDEKDILISGAPKAAETTNAAKRMNESHLANQLHCSFRVYASVLYLKLPAYFKIILRGEEVKHHYIASDLRYTQCIRYRPQAFGKKEDEVDTTIGFLDGAPTINLHGFSIYHKNRLILPFHRVLSSASSKGRGVAGVLEADFIKPTHDKQDFEKSQLYQKLINRLKEMTNEDLYSHLVGYHKLPRAASGSHASALVPTLSGTTATASSERIPVTRDNPTNAIPIAFAPHLASAPVGTSAVATGAQAVFSQSSLQISGPPTLTTGTDLLVDTRKRKMETLDQMDGPSKRLSIHDLAANNSVDSSNQVCQHMGERELKEFSYLKLENTLLRQECAEFESSEKDLLLKEQQLRLELEQTEAQYKSLLNEYISVAAVRIVKQ
uniref:Morc S5 domain-containing protein n=1 Tax=Oryza punctata TaxID=4537 RepID=A0A0E0MF95_ORYPU